MTKKYQLLLHIGLHKTATTSLQQNVLHPLHEQGKINELSVRFHPFLRRKNMALLLEDRLSHAEVVNLRGGLRHY